MKKIILVLCCGLFLSAERNSNAQTVTFNYTGSVQTWTVPCGVTTVTVDMAGAQGGSAAGKGGRVQCTYTTTPSTTFNIYVGGQGAAAISGALGGFNGGGNAGTSSGGSLGSGGGGGTDIRVGGVALANRVIVAGGGGGLNTINGGGGAGGGLTGGSATNTGNGCITLYATGGTQIAGGIDCTSSGACCTFTATPNGALGVGANGAGPSLSCNNGDGGGGGGGGWYGGGGGGGYSSGGGGSNWTNGSCGAITNTQGFRVGNGYVTLTWTAPAALSSVVAHAVTNVSCHGGSNGSANETITGGSSPYTYLWTPSAQTVATATGLSAGTYTIGVTDACGTTASASVAITQPLVLAATATTTTNVTCHGSNTGATGSTVTGGTTPYSYLWTGGSTNATATGLTAGSYTLSVTDMNGCSATASTVVTQPNALSDSAFTIKNVLCNGGNTGSASNIAKGGNAPYTYLWTPGGATKDTASGLSAGTYTLMVSDACGASATASATITQPTAISITSHSAPDNGHGVGTAVVSVSGGVGPYTYLWNPGGNTTDSIGGKTKGTYCCDVKDANGCKDSICVVIKTTAGIDGITGNSAQIVVYPNPNNGQFNIESSIDGASSVEIYNILGEKVYTKNLSTTKGVNTINVNNQPNGVYLYRIISDNGNLLGEGRISIQK